MKLVYCLYGLDQKRIENKRNEIIKEAKVDEFNTSIFDMDETSILKVIDDANSIPFLTDSRVVIMKNAKFLSTIKSKKDDDEKDAVAMKDDKDNKKYDLEKLKEYILNPTKTSILIIEVPCEKLDSKKSVVKAIKDIKADIEFKPLEKAEVAVLVTKFVKDNGYTINTDSKEELVKRLSSDPYSIENELDKLSLYLKDDKKITMDIIKNLIIDTDNQPMYLLMDAILEKNSKKALETYYSLINQGMEPLQIQGFIIKRFSLLLYTKEILLSGGNQNDLMQILKIASPGQAYHLKDDARKASYGKISRVLSELKDLDYATKSSYKYGSDEHLGFELFLMKI